MMKICKKCKKEKSNEEFGFESHLLRDGSRYRRSKCKVCYLEYKAQYRKKDLGASRKKGKEYSNRWRKKHPEKAEKQRIWSRANRFLVSLNRSAEYAKKNGHASCDATLEEIKQAFTGKCHICGLSEGEFQRNLSLDHCHVTGAFRGWLCTKCNVGLGSFGDTSELLYEAIEYLGG